MLHINRTHADHGKEEKYNVAEINNNDQIDNSTCATERKFRKQSKPCRTMGNRRAQHIFLRQLITPVRLSFMNREKLVQFADNNRKHQQLLGCADCWAQCMSSNRSRRPQYIKPRRHGKLQIRCDKHTTTSRKHVTPPLFQNDQHSIAALLNET